MEIQQIQRVVDAIVLNENGIYNTVYFYGDSNRMQVMLANIERVYTKYYPMAKVIRTDAESFCNKTIRNMREQIFHTPQCDCALYIFENMEQIAGMETTEQQLYGIFDWLLENGRRIIVTGSVPSASIDKLAPRIRAQLDGGISFWLKTG